MLFNVLVLALPVVLVAVLGVAAARWDTKRWEARCRAESRPVRVQLFPDGPPLVSPRLDVQHGRAVRRDRHARGVAQ